MFKTKVCENCQGNNFGINEEKIEICLDCYCETQKEVEIDEMKLFCRYCHSPWKNQFKKPPFLFFKNGIYTFYDGCKGWD